MVEEKPAAKQAEDYEETKEDRSEGEADLQEWRKERQRQLLSKEKSLPPGFPFLT